MRRSPSILEDAAGTAADAAEVALDVLDDLAGEVVDVAARGARHAPFLSRRRGPSWMVKGIAAALIVIGVIAVIHTIVSRRKEERQQQDEKLDKALADSFPASDPPAMTSPS